jgi:hypothetical protein
MTSVKVKTILKHGRNKAGDIYEVTDKQAQALTAIGLVEPANQIAAKAVEKVARPD